MQAPPRRSPRTSSRRSAAPSASRPRRNSDAAASWASPRAAAFVAEIAALGAARLRAAYGPAAEREATAAMVARHASRDAETGARAREGAWEPAAGLEGAQRVVTHRGPRGGLYTLTAGGRRAYLSSGGPPAARPAAAVAAAVAAAREPRARPRPPLRLELSTLQFYEEGGGGGAGLDWSIGQAAPEATDGEEDPRPLTARERAALVVGDRKAAARYVRPGFLTVQLPLEDRDTVQTLTFRTPLTVEALFSGVNAFYAEPAEPAHYARVRASGDWRDWQRVPCRAGDWRTGRCQLYPTFADFRRAVRTRGDFRAKTLIESVDRVRGEGRGRPVQWRFGFN